MLKAPEALPEVADGAPAPPADVHSVLARCHPTLRAMAYSRLGNPEDAEDAVQETYVRVLRRAGGVRPEAPLEHWILTVASNVIRDRLRSYRVRPGEVLRPSAGHGLLPQEAVERREDVARIRKAVADLEPHFRAPLLLYYVHGLEQCQVAELLEIPVETLRMRLYRAIRKVRETLREEP